MLSTGLDDTPRAFPRQHVFSQDRHERNGSVQVFVRDNNVDQALRILKRKMQREGVFREMKRRKFYEKPSERTARERAEAIRRARKLARKVAQREGLVKVPARRTAAARAAVRPAAATGGRTR
jgi:small subunit ribosomal protein S21